MKVVSNLFFSLNLKKLSLSDFFDEGGVLHSPRGENAVTGLFEAKFSLSIDWFTESYNFFSSSL